ncbi:MAG: GNAT family N-acetyltransferase [Candidatus Paceibacterota bacterium]
MSINDSNVRDALPSDAESINEILEKSWLATYVPLGVPEKAILDTFFGKEGRKEKLINYLTTINHGTDIGLVIEVNSKVVGLCFGSKKEGYYLLTQIYIHPDHIGNNLGSKLINCFIEKTKSLPIKVSVYEKNTYAINFYKKIGFEVIDEKNIFKLSEDIELKETVLIRNGVGHY